MSTGLDVSDQFTGNRVVAMLALGTNTNAATTSVCKIAVNSPVRPLHKLFESRHLPGQQKKQKQISRSMAFSQDAQRALLL
jgi:hypothetical protein